MELKNPIFKNMHLKGEEKKLDKGRSFYEVHMMWILFQYFIKSRSQSSVDSI